MALNTDEKILIEQRVANEAKSAGVAYLLWFFLGGFGAHRFYLGATGTAVAQLLLFIIGLLTVWIIIGGFLLLAWGIWWLVDLFLISGMVSAQKEAARAKFTNEALYDQR